MTGDLEADIARHLDAGEHAAAATALLRGYGSQLLGYLVSVLRDHTVAGDAFSALS